MSGKSSDWRLLSGQAWQRKNYLLGGVGQTLRKRNHHNTMLTIVAVVLVILWVLGFATHVLGNFIHFLLVLAIIFFLIRVIQGRNPLK